VIIFALALAIVTAFFGAVIWAAHKARGKDTDSMRVYPYRKFPPRSPARKKRGW
jgi:hypothetical protein